MTLDEYCAKGGQVFRRASSFEAHLKELAGAARAEGLEREAVSLERIAARARPMAEFFVLQLRDR